MVSWIGHILHRNCLLKRVIEGKIGGSWRRGRRSKQLLYYLKETRGFWRTRFEIGYGSVRGRLRNDKCVVIMPHMAKRAPEEIKVIVKIVTQYVDDDRN
jgi:hypothetical protein